MTTTMTFPDPVLVADRDAPYRVIGVYEKLVDGCRDEVVLAFNDAALTFRADPDTDALETHFTDVSFQASRDYRPLTGTALDSFIGSEFGWSWVAVNQQGYADSALLSFDGIIPNVLVHVTGSSVKVLAINALKQQ